MKFSFWGRCGVVRLVDLIFLQSIGLGSGVTNRGPRTDAARLRENLVCHDDSVHRPYPLYPYTNNCNIIKQRENTFLENVTLEQII